MSIASGASKNAMHRQANNSNNFNRMPNFNNGSNQARASLQVGGRNNTVRTARMHAQVFV